MTTTTPAILSIVLLTLAGTQAYAEAPRDRFDADQIERRLEARGADVERVEEWNGFIRAFERSADGSVTMRYYSKDTLQPVEL